MFHTILTTDLLHFYTIVVEMILSAVFPHDLYYFTAVRHAASVTSREINHGFMPTVAVFSLRTVRRPRNFYACSTLACCDVVELQAHLTINTRTALDHPAAQFWRRNYDNNVAFITHIITVIVSDSNSNVSDRAHFYRKVVPNQSQHTSAATSQMKCTFVRQDETGIPRTKWVTTFAYPCPGMIVGKYSPGGTTHVI